MNFITGDVKNNFVLFFWTAGLIVLIAVFCIITGNAQTKYLLRSINDVFISNDDNRRVISHLPLKQKNTGVMGFCYSMYDSDDIFYVFTVFQDGILNPFGAVVSADGFVKEVIPLSSHAKIVSEKIPESVIQMYLRRIQTAGEK